ncbi:AAA family ATPase [Haloarculaceae archaeon H-GB11]|nr:AAA family ATPase [Haloarculaceae archaeon H-GB11]
MSLFDSDQNLYDDREAVTDGYVPDELVGRAPERAALTAALDPDGSGTASDVLVWGPPGTGKSTFVKRVLDSTLGSGEGEVAYVDCSAFSTPYQVAARVADELNEESFNTTGHSREDVYDALDRACSDSAAKFVALDGVEALAGSDLLDLFLDDGRFATATLVGVADVTDLPESRFDGQLGGVQTVRFEWYSVSELRELLRTRASYAFTDHTLSEEVVPLCAAYAMETDRGATEAIALLRTAGDVAARQLDSRIAGYHVQRAREEREHDRLRSRLGDVDVHGRLTLYAVVAAGFADETPLRTRDVYDRYRSLAHVGGRDTLVVRRVRVRLSTLADRNLLTVRKHNEGRGGGVYREYDLPTDPETMAEVLSAAANLSDVHRSAVPS